MLSKLMAMSKAEIKSKLQAIDVSAVKGRSLKRKFESIRNRKQGGFTLLELLVVIAILAAIAGTATIMLQDTDRKASAGAHVAMMDELSKGIQTYRVLNSGNYPNTWDSLLIGADLETADPISLLNPDLVANIATEALTQADVDALNEAGITNVRLLDPTAVPDGAAAGDCANANLKTTINNKGNNVVPGNIFRIAAANGCGYDSNNVLAEDDLTFVWSGAPERVGVPIGTATAPKLIAFGVGPDSTLFNPEIIGALSSVPTYRHVDPDEYNRFIVLWNVGSATAPAGVASFQAIIDGAGDTKDEELGELDNIRAT
ncbi:hypothetical protein AGMMS49545_01200 [Betaproteobacteria bacterium]|nr:hypothetical protein AGMMS49545_01200 [Betaproteobacteria bacterium]GHT91185.1 hypothetical protein FACS1894101_3820 [Betaproteobacteria bacterium]